MCTLTELFSGEEDRGESPSLSEVVTSEVLRPLADDKEAMEEIASHLPSEQSTEEVLTSPQFQQALGVFGSALSSGQLGPLMGQFGLSTDVATAAATGGVCVCVWVIFAMLNSLMGPETNTCPRFHKLNFVGQAKTAKKKREN